MRSRCFVILCFIASISIASGLWYDEEDWGLEYPELTTFVCPSNGPITSVYSEYNHNTSQREWKFSCDWNELTDLDITTSWSPYKNNFQQDFSFSCAQFDESHFIFGFNVLYDPKLADGRWRFGCGRFPPEYQLVNCTEIPSSDSIGKLQEVFEYTATDNTTFVTGVISEYDNGLKDRMWGLAYCKLGIVQCDKPPQPEGVEVTYDSLEYGSLIKYNCKKNYTYFPEGSGSCDKYGLWTTSPPDCQPCSTIPYCQSVLCTSSDLTVTVCLECQNFTDDGLELERTSNFRCEAEPMITNSLPKTILFYSDDILTLNCNAIGYPKPKVVWLHNSTVVSPGNGVLVLSNGSLVILSPIPSDAGLYVCMAINDRQNLSISVTLKWREFEPPIIVDWTNTVYFLLKHSAKLDCIATGHPQPNIIWYKDGNLIEHKKRIKIFVDNGTLFITKVKEKDIGKYRCEAKNKIGWIAREALVHVYEKVDTQIPEDPDQSFAPIIKSWNLLVQGFPNDQVVLNCNSSGNPKPKIKWSRVTSYGYKVIKENNRTFLYDNGSLIIKDVDLKDRGQYVCQASNTEGVVEKHLLLMVKPRTSTPTSVVTTTAPSVATTTTTTTTTTPGTATSVTVSPTSTANPADDGSGSSVFIIVGVILAGIILVSLFFILFCFFGRKRGKLFNRKDYDSLKGNGTLRNNIPMVPSSLDSKDNEKTNHNQPEGTGMNSQPLDPPCTYDRLESVEQLHTPGIYDQLGVAQQPLRSYAQYDKLPKARRADVISEALSDDGIPSGVPTVTVPDIDANQKNDEPSVHGTHKDTGDGVHSNVPTVADQTGGTTNQNPYDPALHYAVLQTLPTPTGAYMTTDDTFTPYALVTQN